jgi:hypothetical protein
LNGLYGEQGNSFNLDRNFRTKNINNQRVNDNFFAYENVMFSGSWKQFSPVVGNPAFPHYFHYG